MKKSLPLLPTIFLQLITITRFKIFLYTRLVVQCNNLTVNEKLKILIYVTFYYQLNGKYVDFLLNKIIIHGWWVSEVIYKLLITAQYHIEPIMVCLM